MLQRTDQWEICGDGGLSGRVSCDCEDSIINQLQTIHEPNGSWVLARNRLRWKRPSLPVRKKKPTKTKYKQWRLQRKYWGFFLNWGQMATWLATLDAFGFNASQLMNFEFDMNLSRRSDRMNSQNRGWCHYLNYKCVDINNLVEIILPRNSILEWSEQEAKESQMKPHQGLIKAIRA